MVATAATGLRHVARDMHRQLGIFIEQAGNGEQANAKATLDAMIITLQSIQTAVNASSNATITTATVNYLIQAQP